MAQKGLGLGALVEYDGALWVVEQVDGTAKTLYLSQGQPGVLVEIVDDDPKAVLKGHPRSDWPFEVMQTEIRHGAIQKVLRTTKEGVVELQRLQDWVPSNFQRPGGPIFFNPQLRLRTGEVLLIQHASGHKKRLTITPSFGSLAKREARRKKAQQKSEPKTVYKRILKGPFDE